MRSSLGKQRARRRHDSCKEQQRGCRVLGGDEKLEYACRGLDTPLLKAAERRVLHAPHVDDNAAQHAQPLPREGAYDRSSQSVSRLQPPVALLHTCSDCCPSRKTSGHTPLKCTRMRRRTCALEILPWSKQLSHSPDLITDGAMNAPTAWTHNAAHTTFIF